MKYPSVQDNYGDAGPWTRHISWTWHRLADPMSPADPIASAFGHNHRQRDLDDRIAHWTPLIHILRFALGWADPGKGLAAWFDAGRPHTGRVLTLIDERYGGARPEDPDSLESFAAWFEHAHSMRSEWRYRLEGFGSVGPLEPLQGNRVLWQLFERFHADPVWCNAWSGASDPLHLNDHSDAPLRDGGSNTLVTISNTRRALLAENYVGWYHNLMTNAGLGELRSNEAVEVYAKPVGWLGTFRRSPVTGLWYRGTHAVHLMGSCSRLFAP